MSVVVQVEKIIRLSYIIHKDIMLSAELVFDYCVFLFPQLFVVICCLTVIFAPSIKLRQI